MNKEIEIPEGYEARIEGNNVIIELMESEDERIRKEIISFFEQFTNEELRGVNISDWIDWLKKRKEQKPISFNGSYNPDDYEVIMKGNATCLKRKEKNPAEWSEDDEKKLRAVISLMRASRVVDPFYDKMCLEGWLKSLPERFDLQPIQYL